VKVLKDKRANYVDEDGYHYYAPFGDSNNDFILLRCVLALYGSCPCEIEITDYQAI
jgi:hypothetical protein